MYYLPGFMTVILNCYEEIDVFTEGMIYKLCDEDSVLSKGWILLLNDQQKNTVSQFIKYILENHQDDFLNRVVVGMKNLIDRLKTG